MNAMDRIKHFFSSRLRSSLFTLCVTLIIVLAVVLAVRENNKLLGLSDVQAIALEDAGIDEFDFDAYEMGDADVDCFADFTIYYDICFTDAEGFEYTYNIRAKDGYILDSTKEVPQEDGDATEPKEQ